MYSDPTKIRSHVVKIRFSADEHALVEAFTNYTGEQKAGLIRDLVLSQASQSLRADFLSPVQAMEGNKKGVISA